MAKTRTFYLTFGEKGTPKCTIKLPSRRIAQVSVRLRLTIPDGLFARFVPTLAVTIPPAAVHTPTVEAIEETPHV